MDIDMAQLKQLMRALRRFDLAEIDLRQGDQRITLRRYGPADGPAQPAPRVASRPGATEGSDDDPTLVKITSPIVGTFYRAPAPGASPFVELGSAVRPGMVLCIIEAMKLMNELESEVEGTVLEILVENGQPVEFGQALFRVRRSG